MDAVSSAVNVVVVRGVVSSEPRRRDLPSGAFVTQLDVTTRCDTLTAAMPVVVHDRDVDVSTGDEVVVTGHVQRRFFRTGGRTESRTEVVADRLVKTTRRRSVERAVAAAIARISG